MQADPHSIAFISCVSDEKLFSRSVSYINGLHLPQGFSLEIVPVYRPRSMAAGYNAGMRASRSKYKVYLHQDTFLINPYFIYECLEVFGQEPAIGMIGVMGSRNQPSSGTWWEGEPLYTKWVSFVDNVVSTQTINEIRSGYEPVRSIDGALMVTQYDLEWDERVEGFHFYDAAHSIRFTAQGYLIAVPAQKQPWMMHYRLHDTNWEEYYAARDKFTRLYEWALRDSRGKELEDAAVKNLQ
ncbi:glycosyltransferase family protein [Paenibacillus sp. CECT 9249]|uniref:glycosyltransferase family protein n=1 Tax=unclassified Paenibacillus TaxID=185978 RepID=UPI001C11BBDB|nr:glycosyltransferase family protein [Paenibacillus sp. CECT 9249]MBU5440814.1 glycosyltransferase family protein [Paenibacillus sp. MSJ-34]CAH0118490.1 hypothetical protein PAE9249_00979 [Paenibacillus sp. CECT 9249]